jgi:hypothetical protein
MRLGREFKSRARAARADLIYGAEEGSSESAAIRAATQEINGIREQRA